MAKNREHELILELRAALVELDGAREAEAEAKRVVAESRAAEAAPDTADERQRGPTADLDRAGSPVDLPPEKPFRPVHVAGDWKKTPIDGVIGKYAKKEAEQLRQFDVKNLGDLANVAIAEGDLEDGLLAQCVFTDTQIKNTVDALEWYAEKTGWKVAYLSRESFDGFPLEFIARFRAYLEAERATDVSTRASAPLGTADPAGMCALHEGDWTGTKIGDVILGADVRGTLKKHGVLTLGDLADAADGLGLWDALHPWCSTVEITSIEHDLAKWLRKYPKGFPADLVAELSAVLAVPPGPASPPLGTADPFEFAVDEPDRPGDVQGDPDELLDELHNAIFPEGVEADWKTYRDLGYMSDSQCMEVLRSIWPTPLAYSQARAHEPGHTTRGGSTPAFWRDVLPPGKNPPPDLTGRALADAVRTILRIPPPEVQELAAEAETPPAKVVTKLHEAVAAAFAQLAPAVKEKLRAGATDEEIGHALPSLPTMRWVPGTNGGTAWAVSGGNDPALWYDAAAKSYPDRKRATLNFEKLIGAVRLACKIPYPRVAKPRKSKPAAAAAE